jgi:hypothetical protein
MWFTNTRAYATFKVRGAWLGDGGVDDMAKQLAHMPQQAELDRGSFHDKDRPHKRTPSPQRAGAALTPHSGEARIPAMTRHPLPTTPRPLRAACVLANAGRALVKAKKQPLV